MGRIGNKNRNLYDNKHPIKPKHPRKWVSWQDGNLSADNGKPRNPERRSDMENLANEILDYRAKNGLSLKKFAELCNLTEMTICHIERGSKPSRLTAHKILRVIRKEKE